jgi:hypothetical protein
MYWDDHSIDWTEAIERNREALLGIVAALFAMLGLVSGGSLPRTPRAVHRAVLRVLTPAEAALRRLIVIAARGLIVNPARSRPKPQARRSGKGRASPPPFRLSDPQKRASSPRRRISVRVEPRIHFFDVDPRICALPAWRPKPKPLPDGCVDPKRLCRRLEALKLALADIPRQARRLARWRARQEAKQPPTPTPQPVSPLREGPPPGTRKRPAHEIDDILIECHDLALYALTPDTS